MPSFGLIRGFDLAPANGARDPAAVLVAIDSNRLDIGSRRCLALMIELRLCFQQVAGILKDDVGVGVARLMGVNQPHPGLRRVLL